MDQQNVIVVVLILIIAVFVIFVTWGSLIADEPKRGGQNEAVVFVKRGKTPGWSKVVKSVLGGFGKKTSLSCTKPMPEGAEFQCAALPLNTEMEIQPESGKSFRPATFFLVTGRALIKYHDRTEKAKDLKLSDQSVDLPNADTEDPKTGSIVALEDGGKLTISCIGNQPCQVGLK